MKLEVDRSATRRITDRDRLIARQAQPEDAKALAAWKDGWHLEVRMRGRLVGESHGFATFGGGLAAAITDWHDTDRRRAWHAMDIDHDQPFEQCASAICRGEMAVPV